MLYFRGVIKIFLAVINKNFHPLRKLDFRYFCYNDGEGRGFLRELARDYLRAVVAYIGLWTKVADRVTSPIGNEAPGKLKTLGFMPNGWFKFMLME